MKIEKIEITPPYEKFDCKKNDFQATLTAFVEEDCSEKAPAVIVVPGGAYFFVCSDHEGEPIVEAYRKEGIRTFMLEYSVTPNVFPAALMELATSIKYVRENADKYGVNADEVYICGFSAGGHLCCSMATLHNEEFLVGALETSKEVIRPTGAILSYPVITTGDHAHRDSFVNLLGMDNIEESPYYKYASLEKQVDKETCPIFVWTTLNDTLVPMENSMLLIKALRDVGIDFEFHVYPVGDHGLSMRIPCDSMPEEEQKLHAYVNRWLECSANWIKNRNL